MTARMGLPLVLVTALVGAALAFVGRGKDRDLAPSRTVVMSMSDYTFNGTNPTLAFEPGERVRFIVKNDEDSMVRHNFRILGLGIPCGQEILPGDSIDITVTLPRSGEFAYTCCTHPGMAGKLVVTGR